MEKTAALYETIYAQLLEDINSGKYNGGVRLPTEKELTQRYFVSRITAKRALNDLAEAGLVVRIPGRGTFLRGSDPVEHIRSRGNGEKTVVIVIPDFEAKWVCEMLQCATVQCRNRGISISASCSLNDSAEEARLVHNAYTNGTDGIIVFPADAEEAHSHVTERASKGYPVVEIKSNSEEKCEIALALRALEQLISAGSKRIMFIYPGE